MKPKYMNEHRHNKPPKKQINVNSGTTRNEQCANMCANMFLPLAPSSSSNSNAAGCSQRFKYLFEKKIQSEQYKQCKQCNRFTWTEDNIIGTFFFPPYHESNNTLRWWFHSSTRRAIASVIAVIAAAGGGSSVVSSSAVLPPSFSAASAAPLNLEIPM